MVFFIEKRKPSFVPPPLSARETPIPEWVPPIENLNDLGEPIEFTDRDIGLIQSSLPSGSDPERVGLLPLLLREWARVDLRWHFARTLLPVLARRRGRLKKVAKRAAALIQILDNLEGLDRWELVERLGLAEDLGILTAYRNEQNKHRVDEWRSLTATIATAAAEPPTWKPGKGQPRNDVAYLVLMDLAALFEYASGLRAGRIVDRHSGEETGPFLNFVRAVWPVIFGKGDAGLSSQLREWASRGSKKSGIALRWQEWGLIRHSSGIKVHGQDSIKAPMSGA
jgi:hypothetical protein